MSKKPVLTVVETEKPVETPAPTEKLKDLKIRNFWNTCPRKLENLPCETCPIGKQAAMATGDEPVGCEWSINSDKHHYCFWKLIQEESLPDGRMDSFQQQQIAEFLNVKSSNIHFCLKEAVQKLQKNKHLDILREYYDGSDYEDSIGFSFDVPGSDESD